MSKKYNYALKKIATVLETNKTNKEALLVKTLCLIEQHNNFEALDVLNKLKSKYPQDGYVLFLKAFTEWRLGRSHNAMKSISESLIYQPDNKFSLFLVGMIYYGLNMHIHAKHHFDKANEVSNKFTLNESSKNKLLTCYKSLYIMQHRVFESLIQSPNQNYRIWFYRGVFKAISNDNWSAILDLEKSIYINKKSELPYFYMGYTFATIKKYDKAFEVLNYFNFISFKKYKVDSLLFCLNTINENSKSTKGEKLDLSGKAKINYGNIDEYLAEYFSSNIKFPKLAIENKIEGTVIVTFEVDTTEQVCNPIVVNSIGSGCDEEALRVVNAMPKLVAHLENGSVAPLKLTVPIKFKFK